jgi:cytochrome P450
MAWRTHDAVTTHEFRGYAEVVAALADPALVPVPPPEPAPEAARIPHTAAWLRAHVARFAHGSEHARRRTVIEAELARLDPTALRKAAAQHVAHTTDGPDAADTTAVAGAPHAASADPRAQAVHVLARALDLADPARVAADVGLVSAVYFGGESAESDAAVARLAEAHSAEPGSTEYASAAEDVANRISVLIQAYEATGSLVEYAAPHLAADSGAGVDAVLAETLRHDPPLRAMRRVAVRATRISGVDIAAGDHVTLDIAAANRDPEFYPRPDDFDPGRSACPPALTFGSAPRRCPGYEQALALAAGLLAPPPEPASVPAHAPDGEAA